MSNRRSTLATEEGAATPGSPLRRSTRIANSPAPAAAPAAAAPAAVTRRRSFTAESSSTTPGKINRAKRPSLSQEITLEDKPDAKAPATAPGTPAKRGRRPSITKIKEEEAVVTPKPETPSRRRSIRAQSSSPTRDTVTAPASKTATKTEPPKPRGRRASISQVNLEVIKETDTKPEEAKRGRMTRRSSVESTTSTDVEKSETEKKKPVATRRSLRGRSTSVDIPDEEAPTSKAPSTEVITIIEEEETAEDDEKKEFEEKKETAEDITDVVDITDESKTQTAAKQEETAPNEDGKEQVDITTKSEELNFSEDLSSQSSSDIVSISSCLSSVPETDGNMIQKSTKDQEEEECNEIELSPLKVDEHDPIKSPETVFKSPVRRSPRLSASPSPSRSPVAVIDEKEQTTPEKKSPEKLAVQSSTKSPLTLSTEQKVMEKDTSEKVKLSPEKLTVVRRSPRLSDSSDKMEIDEEHTNTAVKSPRRSLRLSESQDTNTRIETEKLPSPRRSLSLKSSESKDEILELNLQVEEKLNNSSEDITVILSSDEDEEKLQETKERRKSSSFTLTDKKTPQPAPRLTKSFGDGNLSNKTPTRTPRRDSLLKRTPEMIHGSDGSFQLNLSIPTTNSVDLEDDADPNASQKSKVEVSLLDVSGGSNTSDKENAENGNAVNTAKSSKNAKRVSLSETSTPKLNKSVKIQSFCDPVEMEIATEVTVAQVAVEPIQVSSEVDVKTTEGKTENSVIEVDNRDEFGSSPVKTLKAQKNKDVTQSEDELEAELMSSFVDEVIEDENITEKQKSPSPKPSVPAETKQQDSNEADKTSPISDNKMETKEAVTNTKSDDKREEEEANVKADGNLKQTEDVKAATGGSKRRKIEIPDSISQELDDLINAKLQTAADEEEDSSDDEDYKPKNEFLDDMAFEGEEDTPSEDSNQIIDDGESLHSSEFEGIEDDDDYEADSFVTDDDQTDLLSGNEYDLDDDVESPKKDKKKKRKSRIIQIEDSSDEEVNVKVVDLVEDQKEKAVEVEIVEDKVEEKEPTVKQSSEKVVSPMVEKKEKIVVLQNIKITSPIQSPPTVVVNKEDNLESLECIKDTISLNVPRDPKPSLATPNNSMLEDSMSPLNTTVGGRPRRKTSITIQDQIKINRYSDGDISDKISKAVDFFVSSIKEKSGNVSVNVSLDYANNSASSADEGSPKSNRRSLKKTDVEDINNMVDTILADTQKKSASVDQTEVKDKKQKKRPSSGIQNTTLQDSFEVNDVEELPVSEELAKISGEEKESKKRRSKSRKSASFIHETEDVEFNQTDNRISSVGDSADSEEYSPKKKQKLIKSVSDDTEPIQQQNISKKQLKKQRHSLGRDDLKVSLEELSEIEKPTEIKKKQKLPELEQTSRLKQKKGVKRQVTELPITKSKTKPSVRDDDVEFKIRPSSPKQSKQLLMLQDMLVEDEPNPVVTMSEVVQPSASHLKKKSKRVKLSLKNADDEWTVEDAGEQRPSRKNKDKTPVEVQIASLQRKIAPNDFKNQMLFSGHVKRMDSKQIQKKKQQAGYKQK